MMKKFLAMLLLCVLLTTPAYAIDRNAEMDAMLEAQMGVSVDDALAALGGRSPAIEEVDHYMSEIARTRDMLHYLMCLVYDQTGYPMPAPTLDGLSYDQLVSYRDAINLAIWNSEEWQEVTVPEGLWLVGEDIPEGYWTITVQSGRSSQVSYGDVLTSNKQKVETWYSNGAISDRLYGTGNSSYINIDMKAGYYVYVDDAPVVFTPYSGKPDLGFK